MTKASERLHMLGQICDIRVLMQQDAERNANEKSQASDQASDQHRLACDAHAEAFGEWSRLAGDTGRFDPMLSGLWAAEMLERKQREAEADAARVAATAELEDARKGWRQAMTLRDQAAEMRKSAARRLNLKNEEARLNQLADSMAYKAAQR